MSSDDYIFFSRKRDLKASAGYPFSKTGRASRAEKLLRATASKSVLGQDPSGTKLRSPTHVVGRVIQPLPAQIVML
jgi:hypothetical protein